MKKPLTSPLLPLTLMSSVFGLALGVHSLRHGKVFLGIISLLFCLCQSFAAFLMRHLAVIAVTPGFKGDRWFKFKPNPKGPSDAV